MLFAAVEGHVVERLVATIHRYRFAVQIVAKGETLGQCVLVLKTGQA
jgi:hypothetical protein